jgi:REP element-mobilizing transposase RayT
MTTGYQIKDQSDLYYLTFQVVNWVDIFSRPVYRNIVIDSLKYAIEHKGLQVFAYVIMSNHVHSVVQCNVDNLSGVIRDIKKFTSKRIIETIQDRTESRRHWLLYLFGIAAQHTRNSKYQVWTHENHAISLHSNEFIAEKINYIHENPVRAMLVQNPKDYLYSSARNYAGVPALLEVEDQCLLILFCSLETTGVKTTKLLIGLPLGFAKN